MENFNTNGTANTNNVNNTINMEEVRDNIKNFLQNTELDVDDAWGPVVGVDVSDDDFIDNLFNERIDELNSNSCNYNVSEIELGRNHKYYTIRREHNEKTLEQMELKYPEEYVDESDIIHFIYNEYYNHLIAVIQYHDNEDIEYIAIKELRNVDVTEQVYDFLSTLLSDRNIFYDDRSEVIQVCIQTIPEVYGDTFEYLDIKTYESTFYLSGVSKKIRYQKNEVVKYEDVVTALRLIRDSNQTEMTLDVWE